VSDIDTAAADGLKVLDPKRPIREADIRLPFDDVRYGPEADIREMTCVKQKGRLARGGLSNDR